MGATVRAIIALSELSYFRGLSLRKASRGSGWKSYDFESSRSLKPAGGKEGIEERSSFRSSRIAKPFDLRKIDELLISKSPRVKQVGKNSKLAFRFQVTSRVFHPGPIPFSFHFQLRVNCTRFHPHSLAQTVVDTYCAIFLESYYDIILHIYIYIFREKGVSVARADTRINY